MTTQALDPRLEALAPLIGEWEMAARFPGSPPAGAANFPEQAARTVFEPALDGRFVLQRAEVPHPAAPDVLALIAPDAGGGYRQHYFDSRGIVRLYRMTFVDGVWTLLRNEPDFSPLHFSQRFTGTVTDGGNTIAGRWESAPADSSWALDFELSYTRLGPRSDRALTPRRADAVDRSARRAHSRHGDR